MSEERKPRTRKGFTHGPAKGKSLYPYKSKPASGIPAQAPSDKVQTLRQLVDIPRHPDEIKKLADQLTAWSLYVESFFIEEFPLLNNYSVKRFFNLANQDDYFANALDNAKHVIGIRRESAAAKSNPQIYMKYIATYNDRYREYEDRKLSHNLGDNSAPIQVIIPPLAGTKNETGNSNTSE